MAPLSDLVFRNPFQKKDPGWWSFYRILAKQPICHWQSISLGRTEHQNFSILLYRPILAASSLLSMFTRNNDLLIWRNDLAWSKKELRDSIWKFLDSVTKPKRDFWKDGGNHRSSQEDVSLNLLGMPILC